MESIFLVFAFKSSQKKKGKQKNVTFFRQLLFGTLLSAADGSTHLTMGAFYLLGATKNHAKSRRFSRKRSKLL